MFNKKAQAASCDEMVKVVARNKELEAELTSLKETLRKQEKDATEKALLINEMKLKVTKLTEELNSMKHQKRPLPTQIPPTTGSFVAVSVLNNEPDDLMQIDEEADQLSLDPKTNASANNTHSKSRLDQNVNSGK
jgi:hypothetical protein